MCRKVVKLFQAKNSLKNIREMQGTRGNKKTSAEMGVF